MNQNRNYLAVILCAGYGIRMYPLTKNTPKPLLQVAGRAIIDYLMDELLALPNLKNIYIITNDKFFTHFVEWKLNWDYRLNDVRKGIEILNDGTKNNEDRLGATGDLHLAFQKVPEFSNMIAVGGDNIFFFPIKPIWKLFINSDDHYVVALIENNMERLRRTGVLEITTDNKVKRLYEKPENPISRKFCPPLYFLKTSAKLHLSNYMKNKNSKDASGYFIDYLCQREIVRTFQSQKGRLDIGNMADYKKADSILTQQQKIM